MFKSLLVAAAMVVSVSAHAYNSLTDVVMASQLPAIKASVVAQGLDWKVGQEANYKLNIGGFLNGTMKMYVKSVGADGIWFVQDMDLMIQKQTAEILIDPNTGEIKKMLVGGKEQQIPKADYEVVDQKEETITVAAGTFQTIYLKVKDNANNGEISEQWVNPRDIPLSGMVKAVQSSQMGPVNIELTSFKK